MDISSAIPIYLKHWNKYYKFSFQQNESNDGITLTDLCTNLPPFVVDNVHKSHFYLFLKVMDVDNYVDNHTDTQIDPNTCHDEVHE